MLAERQSRYKQIAAFYLNEEVPNTSPTTSSQSQSYLPEETPSAGNPSTSPVEITNDAHNLFSVEKQRLDTLKQVPYEVVGNSDASVSFYSNDADKEVESQLTEATSDADLISSKKNPKEEKFEDQVRLIESIRAKNVDIPTSSNVLRSEMNEETADRNIPNDIAQEGVRKGTESIPNSLPVQRKNFISTEENGEGELKIIEKNEECVRSGLEDYGNQPSDIELKIIEEDENIAENSIEVTSKTVLTNQETRSRDCSESEISSDIQRASSSCSNEVVDEPLAMPMAAPHIVLQAPDSHGTARRPTSLHPPPSHPDAVLKRKSPVTVQEWVDHLPIKATAS